MPLKGLLFIGLFFLSAVAALFLPHIGVYGYIADYCIGSSKQWWAAPFVSIGFRFSFVLSIMTFLGLIFHWRYIKYGSKLIHRQESLILLFLGLVWLSLLNSGPEALDPSVIPFGYTTVDHPSIKLAKIFFFALMMTHIITDEKKLNGLFWLLVSLALFLGIKAWSLPRSYFVGGRIEGIGGPDFAESNFFAAFMASLLPIIGIQLLRGKWPGKILCFVSAAFTSNAIVLCRSRGAFLAIAVNALFAVILSPKKYRKKIAVGLVLGVMGGIYLADAQFFNRISTISVDEDARDESAKSRIRIWEAGINMIADYPLGVGAGNWFKGIGNYYDTEKNLDAHNTLIRCTADLGFQGLFVYLAILINTFIDLRWVRKMSASLPSDVGDYFNIISFALAVSLLIMLVCSMLITMIYSEIVWLLLMLPVCLRRATENALIEHENAVINSVA